MNPWSEPPAKAGAHHHFDAVVVGATLPGVVAASLLAERGARVLLLRDLIPPASYEGEDGQPCLRRPFIAPGADAFPALTRVLSELKLHHEFVRSIAEPDPAYQVLLPEHRVDVWRERDRLAEELTREFGDRRCSRALESLKALEAALGESDEFFDGATPLPADTWRERRVLSRRLRAFPIVSGENGGRDPLPGLEGGDPLRAVLLAPGLLAGRRADGGEGRDHGLVRALGPIVRGLYRLPEGEDRFSQLLLERFRAKGGECWDGSAEFLESKRSRLEAVRCEGGARCGFQVLVSGAEPTRLQELLGDARATRKLEKLQNAAAPRGWLGTVNVIIRGEGVPEPLAERSFLIEDPRRPLTGDNLLFLDLAPPADGKDGALRALRVCAVFGPKERPATADELGERVLARLRTVIPFLDEHLERTEVASQAGDGRDVFLAAWAAPHGGPLAGTLPCRGPLKNLVFAHRASLPGLGLEGELLAGYRAAGVAFASLPKKRE